jgi:hypothetical protein
MEKLKNSEQEYRKLKKELPLLSNQVQGLQAAMLELNQKMGAMSKILAEFIQKSRQTDEHNKDTKNSETMSIQPKDESRVENY